MASNLNGGHAIAELLRQHGVRHIFGMDSPELLYQALDPAVTRAITIRDERSGGFAADAIGRLTGRPSVACGIHGPGATNLITAVLEARAANSPLVCLVSDIETANTGRNAFQEADHVALFRPLVKWAVRIERADRIAETVNRALTLAVSGRPGPVLVAIPNDLIEAPQESLPAERDPLATEHVQAAPARSVAAAAALLAAADRPAILAGNGARMSGAGEEILALADYLAAPIGVTAMGRTVIDETHPLFAGVTGALNNGTGGFGTIANSLLADADVLVVAGSSLDGAATNGLQFPHPGQKVIHIDIDADEIGRIFPGALPVPGDARATLQALLGAVRELAPRKDSGPLREEIASRMAGVRADLERLMGRGGKPIYPGRIYGALAEIMGPNAVFTADASYSSIWSLSTLQAGKHFSHLVYGRAAGTLGFGFPAALGAKLTYPDKTVINVVGDGGFGYDWGELETAARERINVVCIVLNNGALGYQTHYARELGQARWLNFADVRHDRLAEACGLGGALVEDPEDLVPSIRRAMDADRTWVIDVRCDLDAMPPMSGVDQVGH